MRLLPGMVMLMLVLVISGSARATTDVMPFKDEAQEQQFRQLTEQLRCPKCQNNSIADSNAMIATDMRRLPAVSVPQRFQFTFPYPGIQIARMAVADNPVAVDEEGFRRAVHAQVQPQHPVAARP